MRKNSSHIYVPLFILLVFLSQSLALPQADKDAEKVASILGIPHFTIDASQEFRKTVIDKFCDEYKTGRTPNPCIHCNRHMKFKLLKKIAAEQDVGFIATGHYARIVHDRKTDIYYLKRAINEKRDQSYFLYMLNQTILQKSLLPLGSLTKDKVRNIAQDNHLPVFEKEESQEICFIDGKDYRKLFKECSAPGPIINREGKVLGTHTGIVDYTIGQRRGLGIATGKPLYVTDIDSEKNVIVVGSGDEAYHNQLITEEVNWISHPLKTETEVLAKIRSVHRAAKAKLIPLTNSKVELHFFNPQWAVAPGQSAVFYDGDTVVGGGIIESASRIKRHSSKPTGSGLPAG